jgi:NAD(P)-dependent dehydrogenase (short-subunit alcohol dehydrogenase family)
MRGRNARYITITNSTTIRIVPRAGLFAVAKAGMEVLTEYLAYELAKYGIIVNGVRPGLVQTEVFKVRPDFEGGVVHERTVTPWREGQMTTVENSADAVALLCLPEASWIAGQTINVDGGYSLWGAITGLNNPARAVTNGHVEAPNSQAPEGVGV